MSASKRFGALLTAPPKPLPDDDEATSEEAPEIEVVEEPEPEPEPELVVMASAEPKVEPAPQVAAQPAQPEPVAVPAPVAAVEAAVEVAAEVAGESGESRQDEQPAMKVPLTLRLQPTAARAFRDAWFEARRTKDPMLSSPSFASEIVMLGLTEYNKKLSR